MKKLQWAGILSMAVLALAGCVNKESATAPTSGTPAAAASPASDSKEAISIGYLLTPDPQAAAAEMGYFKKNMTANTEFKSFDSGPAAFAALASGSIQFMTVIGNPPTVNAISKGIPIEVIWALDLYTTGEGLIVKKNSGIKSLKDLVGKKVGIVTGSTSDLAFSTALKEAGIDPKSVTFLDMSPPNMVAAWKSNNLDAAFTWDPAKTEMVADGGEVLVYDKDQSSPIWNLAVVNKDWAAKHKDLVKGFIKSEMEAVNLFREQPDQSIEAMAKWNNITKEDAAEQAKGFEFISIDEQLTPKGLGEPGKQEDSMVGKGLKAAAQNSLAKGLAKTMPDSFNPYINTTYIQEVLAESKH
jgi:NitT/TauT family transport system substrate-binding protein/taurine transport system substrate-binding protein